VVKKVSCLEFFKGIEFNHRGKGGEAQRRLELLSLSENYSVPSVVKKVNCLEFFKGIEFNHRGKGGEAQSTQRRIEKHSYVKLCFYAPMC